MKCELDGCLVFRKNLIGFVGATNILHTFDIVVHFVHVLGIVGH